MPRNPKENVLKSGKARDQRCVHTESFKVLQELGDMDMSPEKL